MTQKLIILSGSETEPLLFSSPLLILSTNSIPEITFPNTVYCLSKKGSWLKTNKELTIGTIRIERSCH